MGGTHCYSCVSPCATCQDSVFCNSCLQTLSNNLSLDGSCVEECVAGTTEIGTSCQYCSSSCKTCSGSISSCTSCYGGDKLYNNACFDPCPDGTLESGTVCVKCSETCATCAETVDTCTTCTEGLYVYDGTCTACPSGYTGNDETGQCDKDSSGGGSSVSGAFIPFPFILIAIGLLLVAILAKCKSMSSQIMGNTLAFWSVVEFFLYFTFWITAYATAGSIILLVILFLIWILMIAQNIAFAIYFCASI